MEPIYQDLILTIKNKTCTVHNQHPRIGIIDDDVSLICCCDEFKIACYLEIVETLKEHNTNCLQQHL
jgi:hypothetical protein